MIKDCDITNKEQCPKCKNDSMVKNTVINGEEVIASKVCMNCGYSDEK